MHIILRNKRILTDDSKRDDTMFVSNKSLHIPSEYVYCINVCIGNILLIYIYCRSMICGVRATGIY